MTVLIAATTAGGTSADFGVGPGGSVTIFLTTLVQNLAPDTGAVANIQVKDGALYRGVATLLPNAPAGVLQGPGTYRVVLNSGLTVATGVSTG